MDPITSDARTMAIKDAKEKAQALSRELGVKIVRVASFTDSSEGAPMPYYSLDARGGVAVAEQSKAPTIPTGENKVKVVVQVTYEIR